MTTEAEDKAAADKKTAEQKAADQKVADEKAEADKKVAEENKKPFWPSRAVPPETAPVKGTERAGLERIREAITLISTHSAASIGGSMLSEALKLLEQGYDILGGNKPRPEDVQAAKEAEAANARAAAEAKREEPNKPVWPAKA
jgi:membrane protein involved in colicin uptake